MKQSNTLYLKEDMLFQLLIWYGVQMAFSVTMYVSCNFLLNSFADPSKQSQKQNETVIIASVTAGAILMILAILIVCCVVRARK